MKIRCVFKDPDAIMNAIEDYMMREQSLSAPERELLSFPRWLLNDPKARQLAEELHEKLSKHFRYGEYAVVEIDTEKDTAKLIGDFKDEQAISDRR